MMKIVHLSTSDLGGAYKAVERIHKGMLLIGIESTILLRNKYHDDSTGVQVINGSFESLLSKTKNVFNIIRSSGKIVSDYYGTDMSKHPIVRDADAIFVHWCNSFISYNGIKKLIGLNKPTFIVAHDMWYWTGGCHCDEYCGRYIFECTDCPMLSKGKKKIAIKNYQIKKEILRNITFVCPSEWSATVARLSSIGVNNQIFRIYNPIDYNIFHPIDKVSKESLIIKYGVSSNSKKIVLFGAHLALENEMKGSYDLKEVVKRLDANSIQLVVYGNRDGEYIKDNPLDTTYLGYIKDENVMAEVYSMADVFLTPSSQESFGYTICEALACGTPVVAYATTGITEQVVHKKNGYLAEYGKTDDLMEGIDYCIRFINKEVNRGDEIKGLSFLNNDLVSSAERYKKVVENEIMVRNKR